MNDYLQTMAIALIVSLLYIILQFTMSDNLSPPTLNILCDELRQVVEWDEVAIYLKVPHVDIEDIRGQFSKISKCKMQCLQKWLDQTNTEHSWRTVANAVEKVNPAVAEYIRAKYATILDQTPFILKHEEHSNVIDDQPSSSDHEYMIEEQEPIEINVKLKKGIVEKITDLEHTFAALVAETQESFQQKHSKLLSFYRYLRIRQKKSGMPIPDLDFADITYIKLFNILDNHWNYLNCLLLQRIVGEFLSDTNLPYKVQKYQDDLETFKTTKMRALVDKIKSKQDTSGKVKITLKVKKMWLDVTLKHFEYLVKLLFKEYDESLHDIVVKEGSMYITWKVSKEIAYFIIRSRVDSQELKAIGVISLTVGTDVVFNYDDSQDHITFDLALLEAVQSGGPLSAIALLLEVGGNDKQLTRSGESVISTICKMKNHNATTVLFVASQSGYFFTTSKLLDNGADPNLPMKDDDSTPLMVASENDHGDVVELLLEKNILINTQNKYGITPIYIASYNGHSSVISTLLTNGADPNLPDEDGWTPLMAASQNGHSDVVELLLEKNVLINAQNKHGITAISIATKKGHSSVVSTLLTNGADPNLPEEDGWTPLMAASQNGHGDVVELLLEQNVLINVQNKHGITAIYIASEKGHSSVVSTLLTNGADPNLTNEDGWTPLRGVGIGGAGGPTCPPNILSGGHSPLNSIATMYPYKE